jgi:hypothetical protein
MNQPTDAEDRVITFDEKGCLRCLHPKVAVDLPAEFSVPFYALADDMSLATECLELFGSIPLPVARAILRNMEAVRAGIDLAVRHTPAKMEVVN